MKRADVAQLGERDLAKVEATSSSLVIRLGERYFDAPNVPAWAGDCLDLIDGVGRAGARITAVKMSRERYDEYAAYLRSCGVFSYAPTTVYGYPIRVVG